MIDDVLDRLVADGVTEAEHAVALGYLEGATLLGLEDSGSRMARLGSSLLNRDELVAVDEHLRRLRAVTLDDVRRVVRRVLAAPGTLSVVGPVGEDEPVLAASVERMAARALG